jgi:hypothetical protein
LAQLGPEPLLLAWLAHARAMSGDRAGADELAGRLLALQGESYVPAYHLALAYVGLDDQDRAIDALEQAWVDRDPALATAAVEPRFEPLRAAPRYRQLMARIGLTPKSAGVASSV